jgi:hypothetical protein
MSFRLIFRSSRISRRGGSITCFAQPISLRSSSSVNDLIAAIILDFLPITINCVLQIPLRPPASGGPLEI